MGFVKYFFKVSNFNHNYRQNHQKSTTVFGCFDGAKTKTENIFPNIWTILRLAEKRWAGRTAFFLVREPERTKEKAGSGEVPSP